MKAYTYTTHRIRVEGTAYWSVGYYDDEGRWANTGFFRSRATAEAQATRYRNHVQQLPLPTGGKR